MKKEVYDNATKLFVKRNPYERFLSVWTFGHRIDPSSLDGRHELDPGKTMWETHKEYNKYKPLDVICYMYMCIIICIISGGPLGHKPFRIMKGKPSNNYSLKSFEIVVSGGTPGASLGILARSWKPMFFYSLSTSIRYYRLLHQHRGSVVSVLDGDQCGWQ